METALILSQIFFYFFITVTIIVVGVFLSIIAYRLIELTKEVKALTEDAANGVQDFIERIAELPILSFLLRRKRTQTRSTRKIIEKIIPKNLKYNEEN